MGPRSQDAQRRWCLGHFGAVVLVVVSLFARWVWLHHLDRSGDTLATFRTAATRATLGATRLEHRLPTVSDSSRYCRLTFDMRDKERTETGGLNRTVRLVTFVDDESRCLYRRLNHSATSHGIHLENGFLAEEGHRWNPQLKGGARFDAALRFLGKLPPEELVLMLDGYDTVVRFKTLCVLRLLVPHLPDAELDGVRRDPGEQAQRAELVPDHADLRVFQMLQKLSNVGNIFLSNSKVNGQLTEWNAGRRE